jgi:hypothetical protein
VPDRRHFSQGHRGYLQADAYGGYDAFFKDPARGLTEVGCWAHARRYFHDALESGQAHMGPTLYLIASYIGWRTTHVRWGRMTGYGCASYNRGHSR